MRIEKLWLAGIACGAMTDSHVVTDKHLESQLQTSEFQPHSSRQIPTLAPGYSLIYPFQRVFICILLVGDYGVMFICTTESKESHTGDLKLFRLKITNSQACFKELKQQGQCSSYFQKLIET